MSKQLNNNCCLCCQDMTGVMPAVCCALTEFPAFSFRAIV